MNLEKVSDANNDDEGVLEVRLTLRVLARPTHSRVATLATMWVFAAGNIMKQMMRYRDSCKASRDNFRGRGCDNGAEYEYRIWNSLSMRYAHR